MENHAVVAVINYEDKVFLGKKSRDSQKFLAGEWHVPGETVHDEESDEQALIRGMREETGLEITVGAYLGSHTTPTGKEARWYDCYTKTDRFKCGSDLEEGAWVPKNQVLEHCGTRATNIWSEEIKKYFR